MLRKLNEFFSGEEGQDIAEYAVMLAVILVLVVATVRLVGSNANNVFSQVGSSLNN
jgi:Flp pilus assembly pilin Flp